MISLSSRIKKQNNWNVIWNTIGLWPKLYDDRVCAYSDENFLSVTTKKRQISALRFQMFHLMWFINRTFLLIMSKLNFFCEIVEQISWWKQLYNVFLCLSVALDKAEDYFHYWLICRLFSSFNSESFVFLHLKVSHIWKPGGIKCLTFLL